MNVTAKFGSAAKGFQYRTVIGLKHAGPDRIVAITNETTDGYSREVLLNINVDSAFRIAAKAEQAQKYDPSQYADLTDEACAKISGPTACDNPTEKSPGWLLGLVGI